MIMRNLYKENIWFLILQITIGWANAYAICSDNSINSVGALNGVFSLGGSIQNVFFAM